jgi:hypothetical protein
MTLRQRARAARIADQGGLLIFFQAAAVTLASANHIDPVEHPAFELTLSEPGGPRSRMTGRRRQSVKCVVSSLR